MITAGVTGSVKKSGPFSKKLLWHQQKYKAKYMPMTGSNDWASRRVARTRLVLVLNNTDSRSEYTDSGADPSF